MRGWVLGYYSLPKLKKINSALPLATLKFGYSDLKRYFISLCFLILVQYPIITYFNNLG